MAHKNAGPGLRRKSQEKIATAACITISSLTARQHIGLGMALYFGVEQSERERRKKRNPVDNAMRNAFANGEC